MPGKILLIAKSEKIIQEGQLEKAVIKIIFIFPDNIERDFNNMFGGCKRKIDGIKKAGIILDNNWKRIKYDFDSRIGEEAKTINAIREV